MTAKKSWNRSPSQLPSGYRKPPIEELLARYPYLERETEKLAPEPPREPPDYSGNPCTLSDAALRAIGLGPKADPL
jgi:hypothetical protein